MRLMSFALTLVQVYHRRKWVTRRCGWWDLRPGELLCAVERGQGLARGESPRRIQILRVVSSEPQRLGAIDLDDVVAEGFSHLTPAAFISFFVRSHPVTPDEPVNRIEFEYLPGGRFPEYQLPSDVLGVPGLCTRCGCTEEDACLDEHGHPCWWVDARGRATLGQTSLCSHCHRLETGGWRPEVRDQTAEVFPSVSSLQPPASNSEARR